MTMVEYFLRSHIMTIMEYFFEQSHNDHSGIFSEQSHYEHNDHSAHVIHRSCRITPEMITLVLEANGTHLSAEPQKCLLRMLFEK